jgi:hypothetical protein
VLPTTSATGSWQGRSKNEATNFEGCSCLAFEAGSKSTLRPLPGEASLAWLCSHSLLDRLLVRPNPEYSPPKRPRHLWSHN